jgi:hypothetical protein
MRTTAALLLTAAAMAPAPCAFATWSIILIDTRTGEIAVGSATCLTNFNLRDGTPVLIPGIGAATAQSFVDSSGQNRVFIRDRLAEGVDPSAIITQLATFDLSHQTRQYGIADTLGRTATFSGTSANAWAGGQVGQFISMHGGHSAAIAYAIQGNILTGEPVVTAAVQAVIATEGDLAAKLMAGMQAARLMGGDGRCSCPSGPTACGSPPPTFTKSAHIAYMLIARAGDREGSNGIYRAGGGANAVLAADITLDGLPDLLISNSSINSISLQTNTTLATAPFPKFTSLPTNVPTGISGASPRSGASADIDGDGFPDVLLAAANSNSVVVLRGQSTGGLGAATAIPVGSSPRAVATGDFTGNGSVDFASVNATGNSVSIRLNDGSGQFSSIPDVATSAGPLDIVCGDFGGSPHLDLAVLSRTASRLDLLLGDGAGQFAPSAALPFIPIAGNAVALTAGDFDGDGQLDLALVTDSTRQLQIFLNRNSTWIAATHLLSNFSILSDVVAGDVNGDGHIDLVVLGGPRFATFINDGQGGFTNTRTYTLFNSATAATLADLDGDGDLDLAIASSGLSSSIVVQNYGDYFNDGIGCGTGDYFMNFNIAFQSAAAPDPVIQLQDLYDQWRSALVAEPDAVLSAASFDVSWLPAQGTGVATLTLMVRDWQGQPATAERIQVMHAPGSTGSSTIGPWTVLGGGVYTAPVVAGATAGVDRFRITVEGPGGQPITLMPEPVLTIAPACYPNCDNSTQPPVLNVADFACFLAKFAAGDPYANCDQSTAAPVLNVVDFSCFLSAFASGCR